MQAQLRVVQKQANVQQVRLLAETVIGRNADCNLKIASTQVSRKHCRIVVNELGVYVEDLCSANGTFLDGKRLIPHQPTLAPAGSHLVIGPATFAVEYRKTIVSRPELGAALPAAAAVVDVVDPDVTTRLPLGDVATALGMPPDAEDDAEPEAVFAGLVSEAGPAVVEPSPVEEPPKRMRSLFGFFRRESKVESKAAPVPFLPTEPGTDMNPLAEASAEETVESESSLVEEPVAPPESSAEFVASTEAPAEEDNPFRQFSQF